MLLIFLVGIEVLLLKVLSINQLSLHLDIPLYNISESLILLNILLKYDQNDFYILFKVIMKYNRLQLLLLALNNLYLI